MTRFDKLRASLININKTSITSINYENKKTYFYYFGMYAVWWLC